MENEKLELIQDGVLGVLLQISLDLIPFSGNNLGLTYYIDQVPPFDYVDFFNLSKKGLLDIKITLSQRTFKEAGYKEQILIQKSQAALVGSSSGYYIKNLREEANEIKKYVDSLKSKYGIKDNINNEDYTKIHDKYPNLIGTLLYNVIFTKKQVEKVKLYLDQYYLQYNQKELDGQEKLFQPEKYATPIFIQINKKEYIENYGKNNLQLMNNDPYFNHILMLLYKRNLIKIRKIKMQGYKAINAVIDNLFIENTIEDKKNEIEDKAEWRDDFNWSSQDTFRFGSMGEKHFTSKDRINLFKALTDKKGSWITVIELGKLVKPDNEYIRQTINQIEKDLPKEVKKYITIVSTQEDNLRPKPSAGAYRIKYTSKPQ